ncbi:MAG: hypothetical protein HY815_26415 [Candidatus Riflebacteria bacterium]|nr:hypothetical protein [Candidatus Riflebacteria bacterium]
MEPTSVTVKILEQIRDSIEKTNARLDQTNARLDQTNARLDQTNARLEETREVMEQKFDVLTNRVVEGEIRTATAITALAGTLDEVKTLLKERLDLRDRVERCEHDIVILKERTGIR